MKFCIVSAHLLGESREINRQRLIALQHTLDRRGVDYKLVGGNLIEDYEYGVLLVGECDELAKELCVEFDQACYLRRELDNSVWRCYSDGVPQYLGVWVELTTPVTVVPRNGYIEDLTTGRCYTAEGF